MESKRKRGQKHTKKTSLLLKFLSSKKSKKKIKNTRERRVLSPVSEKTTKKTIPRPRTRARKRERGGPLGITLHTHDTRFHHGTQTNLETVHLQNDRVRAFIKPSERCANVQHRHRGVEIRELARVVRSYTLVLSSISVLGELSLRFPSFCGVREHIFLFSFSLFCFLIPS